jgi:parallel beta-helix repeat protein
VFNPFEVQLMTNSSNLKQPLLHSLGILLFILVGTVVAEAATYYVAQNGNDANSCGASQNAATPKLTFASAVPCLRPGDTLYIRAGVWTEQINLHTPLVSGTADNYIKIAGYPGERPIIRYNGTSAYGPIASRVSAYMIFENFILDGVNGQDATPGIGWQIRDSTNHHFILRNLEIKNFKNHSAVFIKANNITIQNCRLHDQISTTGLPGTRHYGIYFSAGTDGVIEGNDIYNNPGGGIQVYPGPINNVIIRNNTVRNNNTYPDIPWGGIVVSGGNGPITNVSIYNNVFHNNGSSSTAGTSPGIYVTSGATGTKIWNNTVYNNKGWGIVINKAETTGTIVQNNIVFANASGSIANYGTNTSIDHNLTANPNFADAATFDFGLQASSPAIDAGLNLSQVTNDFRKRPRPQGFTHDIGAYEGGSISASLAPPQNLRVH